MSDFPNDPFWVRRCTGARWHLADRDEERIDGRLVITYLLRCNQERIDSAGLDQIERHLRPTVPEDLVCGHNPCTPASLKYRGPAASGPGPLRG